MSRKKLQVFPFMIEVEPDEVNPLSGCSHYGSGGMEKRITNTRFFLKHSFLKNSKSKGISVADSQVNLESLN